MTNIPHVGTLQIDENFDFQKKFWKIQRGGWILIGLLLALAFLGILGGEGMFNQGTLGSKQFGLTAEYKPFVRRDTTSELIIHSYRHDSASTQLFISSDYLEKMQINTISPMPDSVKAVDGGSLYSFSATSPADIHLYLSPDDSTMGRLSGQIGPSQEKTTTITQWVYL